MGAARHQGGRRRAAVVWLARAGHRMTALALGLIVGGALNASTG